VPAQGKARRNRRPGDPCPPAADLARLLGAPAREVHVRCSGLGVASYWTATALVRETAGREPGKTDGKPGGKTGGEGGGAGVYFLSGGGDPARVTAFDVQVEPHEPLKRLLAESQAVDVVHRMDRTGGHLVRVGVVGKGATNPGKPPASKELVWLLQLVAHAPPKLLWTGPGDVVEVGADGCVRRHAVDFSMFMGRRLDVLTGTRAERAAGAAAKLAQGAADDCVSGPTMQETLGSLAKKLPPGRVLTLTR
jgi:hypothetical protein